jgi:RNA polymerase sigma factor (TIGR02999 family)
MRYVSNCLVRRETADVSAPVGAGDLGRVPDPSEGRAKELAGMPNGPTAKEWPDPEMDQRMEVDQEITEALVALRDRTPDAMDQLLPLVYDRLRGMAHRQLKAEPAGHTLSTTALVHEAYLRLVDQTRTEWQDRSHFFAVASRAMRRILVDYARRHRAARRGGQPDGRTPTPISLDEVELPVAERAEALLALDDALDRLAQLDDRMVRVVELRFFAGLTEAEAATALGVSQRTVAREWAVAKGWLYQELSLDPD